MVLATDMSSHFQQIKAMKNILNHAESFNADKSKILSLVIHISDISHPAKDWELHNQWTSLLMEEFFRQGDREKELDLECSPLCDRETTLVAESQLGFIEFIVSPSLEICGDVLDRVHYQMAEANARPVLPASAKAASVVAAVTTGKSGPGRQSAASGTGAVGHQLAAITAGSSASDKQQQQQQQRRRQAPHGPAATSDKNDKASAGPRQLSEGHEITAAGADNTAGPPTRATMDAAGGSGWQKQTRPAPDGGGGPAAQANTAQAPNRGRAAPRQLSASSVSVASSSPSTASSGSSYASIFVASETIASNLRKMIASSSASISKKLNKTAAAMALNDSNASLCSTLNHSCSVATSGGLSTVNPRTHQQAPEAGRARPGRESREGAAAESAAEFEARQANYKHPVIQCDQSTSASTRLEEAEPETMRPAELTSGEDQPAFQPQNLAAGDAASASNNQGGEVSLKRAVGTTLMSVAQTTRSAPPLQYHRIQRPWINCLERNKKMWRERALKEAEKSDL